MPDFKNRPTVNGVDVALIDDIGESGGGGGSSVPAGGCMSGNYLFPGFSINQINTIHLQYTWNTLVFTPWYLATPVTIGDVALEVTSAGSSGAKARIGIYEASPTWGATEIITTTSEFSMDSTGVKSTTINQELPAGRYIATLLQNSVDNAANVRSYVLDFTRHMGFLSGGSQWDTQYRWYNHGSYTFPPPPFSFTPAGSGAQLQSIVFCTITDWHA